MRGFRVTLFERGDLTSGTTGRHHGQLHSGARYAMRDRSIARECIRESEILRKIAPQAIDFSCGVFLVALTPENEDYRAPFIEGCEEAGIVTFSEAVDIEVKASAVRGLRVRDHRTNTEYALAADAVINAAGVWAGKVAPLAGLTVPVSPSPGTMVAVKGRIVNMVISRLRPAGVYPARHIADLGRLI